MVAFLAPDCQICDVLLFCFGIDFVLGNKLSASLGTKFGVTLGDDKLLMRLDVVVMSGRNNCLICLITLLSSVPCLIRRLDDM